MELEDRHVACFLKFPTGSECDKPPTTVVPRDILESDFQTMTVLIWEQVWQTRNKVIFQNKEFNIDLML